MCSAIIRAYRSSSKLACGKPIENVFTGLLVWSAIAATTALESIPPDK